MIVDSAPGTYRDVEIAIPINRVTDADGGVHAVVGDATLTRLENNDVSLGGSVICTLANLGLSFFVNTLTSTITDNLKSQITAICQG
jgi:hypothetical protein